MSFPSFSLFFLGFLPWFLLIVLLFLKPFSPRRMAIFLRSGPWNHILFGAAFLLTLATILQLGEADFGNHRVGIFLLIMLLFSGVWKYNDGFLGVRGFCLLSLFWSNEMLTLGRGHYDFGWIFAKIAVYGIILGALYFIISPYRLRDWLTFRRRKFTKTHLQCD